MPISASGSLTLNTVKADNPSLVSCTTGAADAKASGSRGCYFGDWQAISVELGLRGQCSMSVPNLRISAAAASATGSFNVRFGVDPQATGVPLLTEENASSISVARSDLPPRPNHSSRQT